MSKTIVDCPQIFGEELLNLADACKCFPAKCSRATLERWLRRGSRGVVLESVSIGGRRFVSREGINRAGYLLCSSSKCSKKTFRL